MKLSLYQRHEQKWQGCTDCNLHLFRDKMVFYRGKLPCDLLFVGVAPGKSENISGIPFDGPAGMLLDRIVAQATEGSNLRLAFTNLVCCMPFDEETNKDVEPEAQEIKSCRPRLEEFICIARPRLIVTVGSLAEKHVPEVGIQKIAIVHPSYIGQQNVTQRPLLIRRAVVTLANAIAELQEVCHSHT